MPQPFLKVNQNTQVLFWDGGGAGKKFAFCEVLAISRRQMDEISLKAKFLSDPLFNS
jgi:hypothetical protein